MLLRVATCLGYNSFTFLGYCAQKDNDNLKEKRRKDNLFFSFFFLQRFGWALLLQPVQPNAIPADLPGSELQRCPPVFIPVCNPGIFWIFFQFLSLKLWYVWQIYHSLNTGTTFFLFRFFLNFQKVHFTARRKILLTSLRARGTFSLKIFVSYGLACVHVGVRARVCLSVKGWKLF